jgi:hypothetical protein
MSIEDSELTASGLDKYGVLGNWFPLGIPIKDPFCPPQVFLPAVITVVWWELFY